MSQSTVDQSGSETAAEVDEAPEVAVVSPEEAAERIEAQGAQVSGGARRPTQIPPGLAAKLVEARKKVGRVSKNGSNKDQKYDYVRAEDVIDEAKKGLDEAGVIVLMEIVKVETEVLASRSGSPGKMVTVDFDVSVIDGATGEGYIQGWKGAGADYPGDKAIYKAQTGATKYFLAALLAIPFGDDPETTVTGGTNAGNSGSGKGGGSNGPSPQMLKFGVDLLERADLPAAAKEAIKVWVGGTNPQKSKVKRLIELLKPEGEEYNPAKLVKEAGWNAEVTETRPSDGKTEKQGEGSKPEGPLDNSARVVALTDEISKAPGLSLGQVVELMKASGITPPAGDKPTKAAVMKVLQGISDDENTKLTQAVVRAREAKASAAAAADPAPESSDGTESGDDVDPESVLGQTVKHAEALGVDHLLEQLAELLYDLDLKDVPDKQLTGMTTLLNKCDEADVSAASLAACIRSGIEKNDDVDDRHNKFTAWVDNRVETKANTEEANKAAAAAEAPQE